MQQTKSLKLWSFWSILKLLVTFGCKFVHFKTVYWRFIKKFLFLKKWRRWSYFKLLSVFEFWLCCLISADFVYLFSVVDNWISILNHKMFLINDAIYSWHLLSNERYILGSNNRIAKPFLINLLLTCLIAVNISEWKQNC